MTRQQVADVLGPPDEITDNSWGYEKPFNPGWFDIGFDDNGRLSGYDHETAGP